MLGDPRQRQHAAADDHDDGRRAGRHHAGDELRLRARELEAGRVARFADGAVGRESRAAADADDRDVRLARGSDGRGDSRRVGVADVAAPRVRDTGAGRRCADSGEQRHVRGKVWFAGATHDLEVCGVMIVALEEPRVVRGRPDDRDAPRLRAERQHPGVGEQAASARRHRPRQCPLLGGVVHLRRAGRVDVRPLEEAEVELLAEHATHRAVDEHFGHRPRRHQCGKLPIAVERRQLDVETGRESLAGRVAPARRRPVRLLEQRDREVVRHDDAIEGELVAQQAGQDLGRAGAGQPVDRAVGVHDARETGIADRGRERLGEHLAQLARAELHGRVVHPAFGQAVGEEVLARADDAAGERVGLEAAHVRRPEDAREVRILAVGLLDAAPARIARHVEHRRERLARAGGEHLLADHARDGLDERGIPRGREADRLRKHGGVAGAEAADGFLVDDRRNAEPCVLHEHALDVVGELRPRDGAQVRGRADPRDVARTVPETRARPPDVEAVVGDELGEPHAAELRDLLLERHASQQVVDARVERSGGVAIDRRVAHGGPGRSYGAVPLK